jgi:hypothetical protein
MMDARTRGEILRAAVDFRRSLLEAFVPYFDISTERQICSRSPLSQRVRVPPSWSPAVTLDLGASYCCSRLPTV